MVLPGPLSPRRDIMGASARTKFDDLVAGLVEGHLRRWPAELREVEIGTEDVPTVPPEWDDEVPFGALSAATPGQPARIVVFRRPIEMRAKAYGERAALVNEVLVWHIAELLGRDPDEIDQSPP